jgi:hypothetical protein
MITLARFREIAHLGKYTWEGKHIKRVQQALDAYNKGPGAERLRTLDTRCDEWWQRHPHSSRAQLSDRAWYKQVAMDRLSQDIEAEKFRTETYPKPTRGFKARRAKEESFYPKYRNHHPGTIETVKVKNNWNQNLFECSEWLVGPPPQRKGKLNSEGTREAMEMAFDAVRLARMRLPKGAFNNRGGLPKKILKEEQYPKWQNLFIDMSVGNLIESGLNIVANQRGIPPEEDFVLQHAILAKVTAAVGGAVCSKIASLTLGLLTAIAEPGTRVAQVWHNSDHEFLLVGYKDSPWIVADPWPHNSYVTPLRYNQFRADNIERHNRVTIHQKCRVPFGVIFKNEVVEKVLDYTTRQVGKPAEGDKETLHSYGQDTNLEKGFRGYQDWLAATGEQWGPNSFR